MKIKGKVKLLKDPRRGWVLVPVDLDNMKRQAVDAWIRENTVSIVLDMTLERPREEKTLSQLGYLHAAVWPVFYAYYTTQGIPIEDDQAREKVRDDVKKAIGFVEERSNKMDRSLNARGDLYYKIKSFAGASKEETSEAIDAIIRLAADFGMIVPSPEEYLHKHGATKFDDDENK